MLGEQPDDLFLIYALAMEYLGMNNTNEATVYFEKVMILDENYVPVYYQLGKIYENAGREKDAIAMYEKGLTAAQIKNDSKATRELRAALDEILF